MSAFEETLADFATAEMTTGTHPVAYLREHLAAHGVTRAIDCAEVAHGATVRIAGSVIVRQRPGTAKGLVFATLEDETGTIQTAVMPDLLKERRQVILRSPGLVIEGRMQTQDGHLTVRADRIWPLPMTRIPSHDFH